MHTHSLFFGKKRGYRPEPYTIMLVGCGGNGSAVLLQLPYLHQALRAWGHPGLHVTVYDGDRVSETNTVRQPFAVADVGHNKATVLVSRLNAFWGFRWEALPSFLPTDKPNIFDSSDVVISCVDTRKARKQIYDLLRRRHSLWPYWMDLGNSATSGQFVLGVVPCEKHRKRSERLPCVVDLYPEIADESLEDDTMPSCSAMEALERQEPYINQTLAAESLAMLTRLLRYGTISYHGGMFNAEVGSTVPLLIDHDQWERMRRRRSRALRRTVTTVSRSGGASSGTPSARA
jgi:PRTRC genetic system ThiF family protein